MKTIRDIPGLKRKKSLRLGILLLSTLFIISASALVYARIIIEKPLTVGNTSGVTAGSGSTASGVNFTPIVIAMLAVVGLVVGLSMFGFLREAFKHVTYVPVGPESSPTGPVSTSPGEPGMDPGSTSPATPGIGLPLHLPPRQRDEWEESPAKEREK